HLELGQDEAFEAGHHLRELHEGRVADDLEDALEVSHKRFLRGPRRRRYKNVCGETRTRASGRTADDAEGDELTELASVRIANRDVPGEGVEPPGNRSAVGHISRSVTPASVAHQENAY